MKAAHALVIALTCLATIAASAQRPVDPRGGDIEARGLKATDFPRMTKLADGVYAYEQIDPTKRIVTANNLVVITPEGVLVVEGQGTTENVSRLVADIATTAAPGKVAIKYVVVGSEHGDHTGGDSAFPPGTTFISSPVSKANLAKQAENQRAGRAPVVVPTETVDGRRSVKLGGVEIQILNLGRAHTGGDLEVYLPGPRILFMSEAFINHIFPSMANSYPSEWVSMLKEAEAMNAAVYVPAHGFVDSPPVLKEEMLAYRHALEKVISEGKRLHDAGVPVAEALAKAEFGEYRSWTRFTENAGNALTRVYLELDGQLK
jgi:glyoxylase-like metal-dependent hydrolase (beta-lactamase superfamily II)